MSNNRKSIYSAVSWCLVCWTIGFVGYFVAPSTPVFMIVLALLLTALARIGKGTSP